jgi:hypothetical protein
METPETFFEIDDKTTIAVGTRICIECNGSRRIGVVTRINWNLPIYSIVLAHVPDEVEPAHTIGFFFNEHQVQDVRIWMIYDASANNKGALVS